MKRIGVIGGGQLAWMMGKAAQNLGLELIVQTPSLEDPAVSIAQDVVLAAVDDAIATEKLAQKTDIITFENEFVNLAALSCLEKQGVCFRPQLASLQPLLDKYDQRCYLQKLGLPVPEFCAVENPQEIASQIEQLGLPAVLKARRHGYDGQGTFIIHNLIDLEQQLNCLPESAINQSIFLLEEFVPFTRELAIIAARNSSGEIISYPVVETQQEQQVCRRVIAPADITPHQEAECQAIAHKLLTSLEVVGVFGIELFITAEGKIFVNEIAPRTHNSGHFSIDACKTSQFEQQLRAVCGLPLGSTALKSPAIMVNLLGYETHRGDYHRQREQLAAIPQAFIHWYNKPESRPGRKLGHVTVLLEEQQLSLADSMAKTIESIWYPS